MTTRDVIYALVAILTPVLAWRAAKIAGRSTEKAAETTAKAAERVDQQRVDLATLQASLEEQEKRINRWEQDLADERRAHAATRERANRAEDRVDRLAASLAAHAQWDLLVLAEVRKVTPDFPEPPPLSAGSDTD